MAFNKKLLIPCPILKPTDEEFKDPIGYLSRPDISKLGSEYGIVKVVPPEGWKPTFSISPGFKFHTRLQKLSDLGLTTRSRRFFKDNINRFLKMRRKRQLKLYFRAGGKDTAQKRNKIYYYDLYVAVENMGGINSMDETKWSQINKMFGSNADSEELKEEYALNIKSYAIFLSQNNQSYEFPESDSEDEFDNCLVCGKHDHPSRTLLCDNCDNPYHITCLSPPLTSVPQGSWYCDKCLIGTGEYGFEEQMDVKYTLEEFFQMCQKSEENFMKTYNNNVPLTVDIIEKKFWEFIDVQKSDLEVKYGADIHNLVPGEISGFPMANTPGITKDNPIIRSYINHPFNLTKLPFAKGSLLNYINTSISGMTIPWLYIGSLLSTFCWHVEDHYTLSANYCHFGATKKWYGIPSYDADKFEKLMKDSAPDLFQKQPDLLHQLVTLLSPITIVKNGIRCVYADQKPNEFVITYPRVYHAGFNCGFNFNEAVNFTMSNWLEFGERSINDYKLIKKENVFNHYRLVENILKEFNKKRGYITTSELNLVKRSIDCFERFVDKQNTLLSSLDNKKFIIQFQPKSLKQRRFEDEKIGTFNHENSDDDESLCDICKTHISYQYCIINNESHEFGLTSPAPPPIKSETAGFVPKKISISQLLTPESSPYDVINSKSSDRADLSHISNSNSSQMLSLLNGTPKGSSHANNEPDLESDKGNVKLCEMAQYDQLILAAKRTASEEVENASQNGRKRKSRRLQNKESCKLEPLNYDSNPTDKETFSIRSTDRQRFTRPTKLSAGTRHISKMAAVQNISNLRGLNEKSSIKFCLECCIKSCVENGQPIPHGSTLLYEVYPSQLRDFINETKKNFVELSS